MEHLIGILVGIGLSAASGMRVFVPLLGLSLAGHYRLVPLGEEFLWLASWQAMLVFGVASLVEVGAYLIPWLDHLLDVALGPAAAIAGTLLTASTLGDTSPLMQWSLALIAGGGTASAVHMGTAAVRATVSLPTAGLANPLVSIGEGFAAVLMTVLSVFLPILAFLLVLMLGALLASVWVLRARRRKDASA